MKNGGFRNALIGRNALKDPIWPVLNESNNVLNRRNRPDPNRSPTDSGCGENEPTLDSMPSSSLERCNFISPISNEEFTNHSHTENNFPELSKAVTMKTDIYNFKVNKMSKYNLYNQQIHSNFNSKNIRGPKFRNKISISLSSLIKPPVIKNKICYKRVSLIKKTFCGNKLDSDRPARRKGKSRLVKRKCLTQQKKNIILSRSLKKKYIYNQNFHKAKCIIPCMLNHLNNFNIERLELLLDSLHIEEQINKCYTEQSFGHDNQESEISMKKIVKTLLHSKKFKGYCDNIVTATLLKNAENLVVRLRNLQDKQHAKDPSKTFAKRRYLCGFKETKRFILCNSVKAVIVATDLEIDLDLPSGFRLNEIKNLTEENSIPIVFAGRVKQLGYWTLKKHNISIISILRYEGAEQLYNDFILSWEESKKTYNNFVKEIEIRLPKSISSEKEISQDVEQEIRDSIISKLSEEMISVKKPQE